MKIIRNGKLLLIAGAAGFAMALTVTVVTAPASRRDAGSTMPGLPVYTQTATPAFDFGDDSHVQAVAETPRSVSGHDTPIAALQREADGDVIVRNDPATGGASMVRVAHGGDLYPRGRQLPVVDKASAFVSRHRELFGISDPDTELTLSELRQDQYGNIRVAYQQMHGDVPVFGALLFGHVSEDGRLTAVNGTFVPDVDVPAVPAIAQADAARTAINTVGNQQPATRKNIDLTAPSASLVVYRTFLSRGTAGRTHLAYEVLVTHDTTVREFVYVDAQNGKIVDQISGIHGARERRIYESSFDPQNPETPPPAWRESDPRPAPDPAHEDEIATGGQTYNLFFNLSGGTYRSWDGNDATMITVNNDPTILCPNANWNGTSTNYCSGTSADDVVGHEWTHAYTQETSGLIYQWQSGALNESYSDVFGETVDLINNREGVEGTAATGNDGPRSPDESVCSEFTSETPSSDQSIRWLVGEDAFAFTGLPAVGDAAIRDMWNPRCSVGVTPLYGPDPGHQSSDNYHCSASDAGGVHTNSAINNRAYATLVDGNTVTLRDDGTPFANPVSVNGIGLTKAAHIFWRANSVYNGPTTTMPENADSLEMACQDLIGVNLTKLVTTAEDGTALLGSNEDTLDPTPEASGEVITAADCEQVANTIAAVEMRHDVSKQCGFGPMLDPAPAPRCGSAPVQTYFSEDWENGFPAGWSTGQSPFSKSVLDTREWFLRTGDLPANPDGSARTGSAIYQENRRDLGNCTTDDESGVLFLDSPPIDVTADAVGQLVFEHYVNTELGYDGGNLKISINGGDFEIVPSSAYAHNPYPSNLNDVVIDQNTNPKAGEAAFHGGNENEVLGDWGESQVDLALAGVQPGDRIVLRWDFGQDGCNGNDGWYVDQVELFTCGDPVEPPTQQCNVYPASGFLPLVGAPIVSLTSSETTAAVSGETAPVSDANVRNLTGSHSYMGDLTFDLRSPAGTAIRLFDGANCGAEQGIDVEFDDDATSAIACGDWQSGAAFRPQKALSVFNDEDANGDWTLTVSDRAPQDDGQLDSWALELCTALETNAAPVAGDDSARTRKNKPVTINVLSNDSDADGDCLSITSVTDPLNGTATINGGESCDAGNPDTITYTPDNKFKGTDSFRYQISDGKGGAATATVTVDVHRKDKDDHDNDGVNDDEDDDDDNDGVNDDDDDDDDNDGVNDQDDDDDDNDGIGDDFDDKSTDDDFQSQSARVAAGGVNRFIVTADSGTLAVKISARGPLSDLLTIRVFDPNGLPVAASIPAPDGPMAVVAPAVAGTYSIEVRNPTGKASNYEFAAVAQQFRP